MKVKEVSVEFKATIPTQAFGSVVVDVRWSGDLEPGESPEQATADLYARIRGQVVEAVTPIAAAKRSAWNEVLLSLPENKRKELLAKFGVFAWLEAVVPEAAFAKKEA